MQSECTICSLHAVLCKPLSFPISKEDVIVMYIIVQIEEMGVFFFNLEFFLV